MWVAPKQCKCSCKYGHTILCKRHTTIRASYASTIIGTSNARGGRGCRSGRASNSSGHTSAVSEINIGESFFVATQESTVATMYGYICSWIFL